MARVGIESLDIDIPICVGGILLVMCEKIEIGNVYTSLASMYRGRIIADELLKKLQTSRVGRIEICRPEQKQKLLGIGRR